MRILLTGAGGQLGRMLVRLARTDHDVVACVHRPTQDLPDARILDITDEETVSHTMADTEPDWAIHAAAMTNVDACERDPKNANAVNGEAAGHVARAAHEAGARLAHVSTDYVFDGEHGEYQETDPPNPINAYGKSKLAGEERIRATLDDFLITRTSVVFGPDKKNFVSWLIQELGEGRPVRIVEDQRVSPTYTADLAHQILALIQADAEGVFHTAGADSLTRLEVAHQIAQIFEYDEDLITPIRMDDLDWVAPRPRDTSLDVTKVRRIVDPMPFAEAVHAMKEGKHA